MRGWATKAAIGAFALAAFGTAGGTARAADPVISVGADGTTAPNFSYADAIRERVFVPVAGVDQDSNGVIDRVAVDIIRPKESGPGLKVPAIIDDSPYYTSVGRGNEIQYIHTTANGNLDFFPLFYDNYFVPRGYAYIAAHSIGTAFSTGCPLHGGPGDVAGFKAVIDWLEGRVPAYTSVDGTTPVVADWANGKNAMIGKSYDGTFANGVAATGVDGLTTIVPISAISSWYDYSRMGGIPENTDYPRSLDTSITGLPAGQTAAQQLATLGVMPPDHRTPCANVFTQLNTLDGDDTGDMNPFWIDRDYTKDVSKVKASVFASHGINDDNVRPKQFAQWWAGLAANNVPRKVWLHQEGHIDPFDYRRGDWVDTLHRWMDYWLQGVDNGIMNTPRVDIERSPDVWETAPDWPLPGTRTQSMFLQGTAQGSAGKMGLSSGGANDSQTFKDGFTTASNGPSEATQIANPTGSQASRMVFLTAPLTHELHISGTPYVDMFASIDKAQSNIGAILVDYNATAFSKINPGSGDGVRNTTSRTCWGDSTAADSACYLEVSKVLQNVTSFRISKGMLDSSNHDSLYSSSPVTPGQEYEFKFDVLPTDYVVPAGHQIGLVLEGNYRQFGVSNTLGATFTVNTKKSNLQLPVVGGYTAALASGGFTPDTTAPAFVSLPNVTSHTGNPAGAAVTYALPAATDNEDPSPVVACDHPSGSTFAIGGTLVTCTVTDASGNKSTGTFEVFLGGDSTVGGAVPATLSLTLGAPASFGTLVAGLDHTYTASTTANVVSTAGDATLGVSDPGHLANGAFTLPEALQVSMTPSSWTGPISNGAVAIAFSQHIGSTAALRTGTYSKTLTFTLSTTTP